MFVLTTIHKHIHVYVRSFLQHSDQDKRKVLCDQNNNMQHTTCTHANIRTKSREALQLDNRAPTKPSIWICDQKTLAMPRAAVELELKVLQIVVENRTKHQEHCNQMRVGRAGPLPIRLQDTWIDVPVM